jgi:hypothetical protein
MWVYVDESIHDALGFMVTAFVFSKSDLTEPVSQALAAVGLVPGTDEFNSGRHMASRPELRSLRDALLSIAASTTKIAILISPASQQHKSGTLVLSTLSNVVRTNEIKVEHFEVFFDQGLVRSIDAQNSVDGLLGAARCELRPEQDSRSTVGLQVADAVAHSVAQVLREEMADLIKLIQLGPDNGYDESIEAPLGWTLRMTLRYSFFVAPLVVEEGQDPNEVLNADLLGWGVFVSDDLGEGVRGAAHRAFGKLWLGCVH